MRLWSLGQAPRRLLGQARTPGAPSLDTATAPVLDANGADTKLSAAAATVSREGSGIAGDDVREREELQREAGAHGGSRPDPTGSSARCG